MLPCLFFPRLAGWEAADSAGLQTPRAVHPSSEGIMGSAGTHAGFVQCKSLVSEIWGEFPLFQDGSSRGRFGGNVFHQKCLSSAFINYNQSMKLIRRDLDISCSGCQLKRQLSSIAGACGGLIISARETLCNRTLTLSSPMVFKLNGFK